jgi:hypothetical protein
MNKGFAEEERGPEHVYVVAGLDPGVGYKIVADEFGRLVCFATLVVATVFVTALRLRGVTSVVTAAMTSRDIATTLSSAGRDESALVIVEAQAVDGLDAVRWARELADRVPLRVVSVDHPEAA